MAGLLLAVIYLAFVSLGLPDSLLGSAWPTMQQAFAVPSSWAGYVSMTICAMTIVSSLVGPHLIQRYETKWIVIVSIGLTVIGLLGFSWSSRYWMLFLFAVPYGLGAGSVDASLNHYVANHYSARVMNFLHCFYGLGAVISPNIMALALKYAHWNQGYRWTACVQIAILVLCVLSIPLWPKHPKTAGEEKADPVSLREALRVPGVLPTMIAFFAYCAGEATCFLWTASYFAGTRPDMSAELVAACGSLVFGGLMLGRILAGVVSSRIDDRRLIRVGLAVELAGILLVLLPVKGYVVAMLGFLVVGTGMGPIYPSIQHMAPENFGRRYSAPVIGMQMASAYVGSMLMPMAFGVLQQHIGISIMPWYVLAFGALNFVFLELAYRRLHKEKRIPEKPI